MNKYRLIKAIAITNSILLIITLFCLIRSWQTINTIDNAQVQVYEENSDKVLVTLSGEKAVSLCFGEKQVSVYPTQGISKKDATVVVQFIKAYAEQNNIEITRSTVVLIGEYRLHTLLSNIRYKPEHTDTADIDYIRDSRWYVNAASTVIGIMGI